MPDIQTQPATETPQIVRTVSEICGVEFKRLKPGNYVAPCLTKPETRVLSFTVRSEDPDRASDGYDFTIGEKVSMSKSKEIAWVAVTCAPMGFNIYGHCPKDPCPVDFKAVIAAILEVATADT